jgi:hypothetical protein
MPILDKGSDRGRKAAPRGLARSTRTFWSQSPAPERMDSRSASGQAAVPSRLGAQPRPRGLFTTCANPRCASGWLHLWRSRSTPVFEGGWNCSASCTAVRIEAALRREMEGRNAMGGTAAGGHRHRVPLGLVMLEQGWITSEQLRKAVEAQRAAGQGRLGDWLVGHQGISEQLVTRALSLQWNCPVLLLDRHDPERIAAVLPRLFVEAYAVLPLRVAAGSILYCGFEDRLDPVLTLAAERMLGLRVEAGMVRGSLFQAAHERLLRASFPPAELVSAESESPVVRALAKAVERIRPVESRLIRVHDCLWLRMWTRFPAGALPDPAGVEDVIVSLSAD